MATNGVKTLHYTQNWGCD